MITIDCQIGAERASLFVNGALSDAEAAEFERHLEQCEHCQETLRQIRAVHGLMEYIDAHGCATAGGSTELAEVSSSSATSRLRVSAGPNPIAPSAAAATPDSGAEVAKPAVLDRLGGPPWWLVSLSLHILIIVLAGLVSMAIELPRGDDGVIMVTELQARPTVQTEEPKEKADSVEALAAKQVDATDPNSKENSEIVVPPDILAKAELGDHFETIDPDRPDTHSAYGNPDAQSFHSVTGNADSAGGGGTGGIVLEDIIGVGGGGSRGTGGGFGGGDGTGVGVGKGAGKGSFGQRMGGGRKLMVQRNGGTKATESAVDHGLEWLAKHQEADGHWDCVKHGSQPGQFHPKNEVDEAVTGLALLSFLGAGNTEKIGKYKDNVCKAVAWIKSNQKPDGSYFNSNYGHSMALMAMAEAAGMARIPETIESAQKAVDCTVGANKKDDASSDRGGWAYSPTQHRDLKEGDMSNSGWAMMSLKSAKVAGLKIPFESIEGCRSFLSACEVGRIDGDVYSGQAFGYASKQNNHMEITNAIGLLGRLFFGTPANELENGALNMIKVAGLPGGEGKAAGYNSHGLYYMYYATLVTFQVGGDIWRNWNESLKATLPPLQVKGGDDDGSWPPQGDYSSQWGRVGQTALSILCMEVYYRYQRLSQK